MSGRNLPELLRTNVLQRPETQSIDTSILRPVNFNQQSCRFVFEKKGILDSNSHLQMKLHLKTENGATIPANEQNDFKAYLPTSTGSLAWIKRAYLTIGGRRVSNLDEVGQYNTYMRLHYSNEYKKGIIMPKQGGNDIFMGSTQRGIGPDNQTSINARGFITPYGVLGREGTEYSIAQSGANAGTQQSDGTNLLTRTEHQICANEANCPTFMVSLSQLIPFLKGLQLPLFAINQEVALNIEWTDDLEGHRFQKRDGGDPLTSEFVEKDCLICADYLFYPDLMEDMADEIMNKGGYDVPFDEVLVQENSIDLNNGNAQTFDFQLAYGGKKVKSIVVQRQDTEHPNAGLEVNNIGTYNSMAYRTGQSVQLNIDSQNWYSKPLTNNSLLKAELDAVEGGVPTQVCDYRYCWKSQVDDTGADDVLGLCDRTLNGYAQSCECGTMNYVGIKLANAFGQGKRVSNLPMIYTEKVDSIVGDGTARLMRFYVKTQRVANISSGIVNVIE